MDVFFVLLLFVVAFAVSIRAALIRDQDAERAEYDHEYGGQVAAGWIPDGADGELR